MLLALVSTAAGSRAHTAACHGPPLQGRQTGRHTDISPPSHACRTGRHGKPNRDAGAPGQRRRAASCCSRCPASGAPRTRGCPPRWTRSAGRPKRVSGGVLGPERVGGAARARPPRRRCAHGRVLALCSVGAQQAAHAAAELRGGADACQGAGRAAASSHTGGRPHAHKHSARTPRVRGQKITGGTTAWARPRLNVQAGRVDALPRVQVHDAQPLQGRPPTL